MKLGFSIVIGISFLLLSTTAFAESCSANCSGGSCSISIAQDQVRGIGGPSLSQSLNTVNFDGGSVLVGASHFQRQTSLNAFAKLATRHQESIVEAADAEGLEIVLAIEEAHADADWASLGIMHGQLRRLALAHGLEGLSEKLENQLLGGVACGCMPNGEPYCNRM